MYRLNAQPKIRPHETTGDQMERKFERTDQEHQNPHIGSVRTWDTESPDSESGNLTVHDCLALGIIPVCLKYPTVVPCIVLFML
jgi:hypothetical protein